MATLYCNFLSEFVHVFSPKMMKEQKAKMMMKRSSTHTVTVFPVAGVGLSIFPGRPNRILKV